MEKIIAEIHHIIKDSNHVLDAETTLQAYFSDLVSQLMKEALEALDSELYVPFKAEGWRIANRDSRTITFTFGTVEFMRRRLKKKGEKSFSHWITSVASIKASATLPFYKSKWPNL